MLTGRPEGGGEGPPPPTDNTPAPPPSGSPPAPPPVATGRPDYLPEKFWDAGANAPKWEDLAKSYTTLETSLGKREEEWKTKYDSERVKNRPAKPDDYKLPTVAHIPADDLQKLPGIGVIAQMAHDMGFTQDQFEAQIHEYSKTFTPPDPAAELQRLGEGAKDRVAALESLLADADDDTYRWIQTLGSRAEGFKAIEWLVNKARGGSAPNLRPSGGAPAVPQVGEAEIRALMNTPAYWRDKDPKVIKQVEDYYARFNAA